MKEKFIALLTFTSSLKSFGMKLYFFFSFDKHL